MKDVGPVLGFTVTHDAGAAVVHKGRVLAAINEERLTRRKGQSGRPVLSIQSVLHQTGLTLAMSGTLCGLRFVRRLISQKT